ncbi:MAG TPA: bifunctional [glutamine synthetase] adenylyltransferase/[glutamine synthetase]-adenylyl-L-tyrosine phosphorylase, partial [Alphaproteobacteria bacterium]|nr:bifunctional [glutamine synthetase] adenylyltransferase/[glutamine synthetase]-adenylyl-L-tyrosine phosphorylase [Alphaproteobacteria bacterium]
NIKLGRGGIRDIEFFVQTQQLIAGGRDPSLRDSTTCGAMRALAATGWLDDGVVQELTDAYAFHRTLEHRLQMVADEQTQTMPRTAEGVTHIARFMGYADTGAFEARLTAELEAVQRHYANLFEAAPSLSAGGNLVFTGTDDDPETLETLSRMGFGEAQGVSATIRGWHHGRYRCTRTARSRELLTKLMPALLEAIADTPNPNATLGRFDRFLAGLPAGVQLFSMLSAEPHLLHLLAEVMGSAPRLADYLSRNAGVLDAVLSEDFFSPLPPRAELALTLRHALGLARDYQDVLDTARRFVKDRRFQLGVQALRGAGDADSQGADQALLADVALSTLHPFVEQEFADGGGHGRIDGAGMVILGLGKLGSREMTETSDLDLIFVYDYPEDAQSDGRRPLMGSHYFTRLSQRLINAITAQTPEGKLYDVDMRLRPSGSAGPVATRLAGFQEYHRKESWTWEHMALTRARVIDGPPKLAEAVRATIDEVLRRPRDAAAVARDVVEMRARIAKEKGSGGLWDLKLVQGGLIDVEFACQYLQLMNGARHPASLDPNTCTALDRLAGAGALSRGHTDALIAASRLYRGLMGVLRVAVEGELKPETAPQGLKEALCRTAGLPDFAALEAALAKHQAHVAALFAELVEAKAVAD